MIGTLEITTTSSCKNMCNYCPQKLLMKSYVGKDKYMRLATFKKCLSKVPKWVYIDFAGFVEPFLNPNASDMMAYAYWEGYQLRLFTTLVDLRFIDIAAMQDVKFNECVLHLPDAMGIMKAKVNESYIEIAKEFIDRIGYTNAHCYGSLHEGLKSIFPDCKTKVDNKGLHDRAGNVNIQIVDKSQYYPGRITCGAIKRHGEPNFNHNILLPNGDVTLCCMDYGLKHVIGNLLEDEYDDLFKSDGYNKVMRGLRDEGVDILCRSCKETVKE